MQFQFAHPYVLLLLLPLLAHVLWMARRLHALATPRRIIAVAARCVLLALFVLALAGLRVARETRELTVVYALDESQSIPEPQRAIARDYVRKTLGEMTPDDRAGVVVFGAEAALDQPPQPHLQFDAPTALVNERLTDLSSGVNLALAAFAGGSQKRIVLITDGNQNAGDAATAARAAAAAGASIDVLPLKYANRNDVLIEKALVENRVSLDEPFDIRVIATTRESADGKLSLMRDGKLAGQFDVHLDPDKKNLFVIPTQVQEGGFHNFEVLLDVPGDIIPENNRAFAFTYGEGEPTILLVDGDAVPSETLPAMLQSEKIQVQRIPPENLPGALASLQDYDAIIFNNVGADRISKDQMKMVEQAVHGLGIGFMMIGGEDSFGAGGYNDTPIETALPVYMELKNEKIIPKGAIVPIVHTVEIPQGQYWGEQVILAALDTLHPRDEMGVMIYDWQGGERWLFPLQEVGDKASLRSMISGLQGGDMPSFDLTMQMAYDSLIVSNASVKHMVIVSDGDPQTPNPALAKKIKAAGITISTVCINPHSGRDVQVMKDLATLGGGNAYEVTSYNRLPQIFIKEAATIRKSLIIEEPFTPVADQYSPVLTGLDSAFPQLLGYVGTSPKELADVPLKTAKGDPLFAAWQHGLGRTVAFTSDAKERWAKSWVQWGGFSKFWSQSVRWMLRSKFNRNYQVEMSIDGAKGKITIDAVNDGGEFRNFLDIAGNVIDPKYNSVPVTFRQTAPGRYEAEFDAKEPGTYLLGSQAALAGQDQAAAADLVTGGAVLSYAPEFQNSRSNESLLYQLADMTGGSVLDINSQVFRRDQKHYADPQPLWPSLLKAALFLLLFDIFVRRVLIGWRELAEGSAFAWNWITARLRPRPVAAGPGDQLLEAKKSVRPRAASADESERAAFLEQLKNAPGGAPPPLSGKPGPPLPPMPSAAPKPAEPEDQTSFTGDLLKARRKVRGDSKDKGDQQ